MTEGMESGAPSDLDLLAGDYAEVFTGTDAGKRVFADLKTKYGTDLFDEIATVMAKNVGRYEVVQDIEAMMLYHKDILIKERMGEAAKRIQEVIDDVYKGGN